jgi:hypothetical protein
MVTVIVTAMVLLGLMKISNFCGILVASVARRTVFNAMNMNKRFVQMDYRHWRDAF